jgi:hypothetical protein
VHSNIENNKYYEIKIHHKVSNMLMHPCCHILFSVLIGFDPKCKRISKTLENGFGKSNKKKEKLLFLSLPPSGPIGPAGLLPSPLSRPALACSLLDRPSSAR